MHITWVPDLLGKQFYCKQNVHHIFRPCTTRYRITYVSDIPFHIGLGLCLSPVPTCPKNRKNRGFLRFPDTGILGTIAILRTARFTLIGRIADCSWYLPVMVYKLTEKFYYLKFVPKIKYLKFVPVSKNCKALSSMSGQRSPDRLSLSSYKVSNTTLTLLFQFSVRLQCSKLYIYNR